jgi:hypothetical protein
MRKIIEYHERDYHIIDYKPWSLDGFKHHFRGPGPKSLAPGNFFICFGAAQTYGCYVEKPFPELLSGKLGLENFNAGYAGAAPAFFLNNDLYIDYANKSKFAIIQIMSGRGESNSYFKSNVGNVILTRIHDNKMLHAGEAYSQLIEDESSDFILKLVEETQANYIANMIKLMKKIEVPKILFWFSVREVDYEIKATDRPSLFGKYPQFINQKVVNELIPFSDYYVESISDEGLPQKLVNRFTGEIPFVYRNASGKTLPREFNNYYPSPEMHRYAFTKLLPVCKELTLRN